MKKLKLGRTGLDISQVILGGGWVGGLFIDPNFDIMEKAIELSIKAGINWIDTAESYSDGKSEKNIGYLISSLPAPDKLQISSKARLDPTISETFVSQLDRKLDNTLNRLKVEKLELYQLHNRITFEEIKKKTGKTESDVIKIMRRSIKPSSFRLWRKRVNQKSIKHRKKFEYSRKLITSKLKKGDYL